jgi:hypothetical protein
MRRITGLAMAATLLLGVTACGSDDDGADTSDAPTSTAGDGGTTTDGSDDGGSDDGSDAALAAGFLDEDCQFLLAGAYLNPLASLVPGADADLGDNADKFEALAEKAPEEIQDAMATLSEANAELADALKDVDFTDVQSFTDPDVQSALQELESTFDDDYEAAAQTVSDYVADNCSG